MSKYMDTIREHRKQFKLENDRIIQESLNKVLYEFRSQDEVNISIYRIHTPDGVPLYIAKLQDVLNILEDDGFRIQEKIVVECSMKLPYYIVSLPEQK